MTNERTPLTPREKIASTNAYNERGKRWLYIGVGTVFIVMVGLWGYAMFSELAFFDWASSREARLFRDTQKEFNTIFNDNPLFDGTVKEQLKEITQTTDQTTSSTTSAEAATTNTSTAASTTTPTETTFPTSSPSE